MSVLREAGAAVLFTTGTGCYGSRRLMRNCASGRDDAWGVQVHLALENHPRDIEPLLPAMTVEFGIEMLLDRPADAEIGDQRPAWRHFERPMNGVGFENGNP